MSNIIPTEKWHRAAEQYKLHASDFVNCCSFTEEDAVAQFAAESLGGEFAFPYTKKNKDAKFNGYAVGKHWQGVMESYYREDIVNGHFCKAEFGIVDPKIGIKYSHSKEVFESIQSTSWFPYQTILSERRNRNDSVVT